MEEMNPTGDYAPEAYTPRPAWQVWLARLGLVIMLIAVGLWLWHIAYPV